MDHRHQQAGQSNVHEMLIVKDKVVLSAVGGGVGRIWPHVAVPREWLLA